MAIALLVLFLVTIVSSYSWLPQAPPMGPASISPAAHSELSIRHCDFVAYATPYQATNEDFQFVLVPSLNGDPNAVSIVSVNYPSNYLALTTTAEKGRIGVVDSPDVDDASYYLQPGLSNPSLYSIQTLSKGEYKGFYITLETQLSGSCSGSYQTPSGDIFLTNGADKVGSTWNVHINPPPPPASITVLSSNVTHQVNPLIMGCHSDSGYTHQPRGFYSQLIFGESFESKWNSVVSPGVVDNYKLDPAVPFNGKPSMLLNFVSGSGIAGLSNRGIGNEGLAFEGNANYELVVYARSTSAVTLTVRLDDYTTNTVLATNSFPLNSTAWTKFEANLTPSRSATCKEIVPGSDPAINCGSMSNEPGHVCIKCNGQFTIGLSSPGSAHIGYVFLQPGTWGRYKNLPVLLSAVQNLQDMGITAIRQGGTFAQVINWKSWRGPAIQRPSMQLTWGASLISGWGPFEFIDMCNAANIVPIITLSESQSTEDWADLVEYCFGGSSTQWGGMRISDGHPDVYNVKVFELGNEQYNNAWVDQVKAMEDRATSLGMGGQLYYMFPTNDGLNAADAQKATNLKLPIDHIMPDIHVGAGGAIDVAINDFNKMPNFHQSAINCETNAGTHTHQRALQEASDLNAWMNVLPPVQTRLFARAASFCTERSGHYDAFDQGLSFFLPNMTWLQPPGYVHQMISRTWQPQALAYNAKSISSGQTFSAQKSADGRTLAARFVNINASPSELQLTIDGFDPSSSVTVWTLSSKNLFDANTPSNPTNVSPVRSTQQFTNGGTLTVAQYSFNVYVFTAA